MKNFKLLVMCVMTVFCYEQTVAQKHKLESRTVVGHKTLINNAIISQANSITNISISSSSPTCLANGDEVKVEFDFKHSIGDGVRIFVRPMSNGNLTSNYAAHGSPLYEAKQGKGTGSFTISSGKVFVDQIRIQMISKSGDVVHNHLENVQFIFTDENAAVGANTAIPQSEVHVIAKSILHDGTVKISYSDNSEKLIYKGGVTRIDPKGKESTYLFMGAQPNTPPGLPGDLEIVSWLEGINQNLLSSIKVLVGMDEDVVVHYLQKENEETNDLYEQINLRMTYIDFLISE